MQTAPVDIDAYIADIEDSLERHFARFSLRNWSRLAGAVFLAGFAVARERWGLFLIEVLERDARWRRVGLCPGSTKLSI